MISLVPGVSSPLRIAVRSASVTNSFLLRAAPIGCIRVGIAHGPAMALDEL
jgi:hypothetical protein